MPTWNGELYPEYHRGTYTSQSAGKKNNRLYENRLAHSEWLSTTAMLKGGSYDSESLDQCWKIVLCNQFHDIIPGSSIREVYENSEKEYAETEKMLNKVDAAALQTLLQPEEGRITLMNNGSFGGNRIVRLPKEDRRCRLS